MNNNTLLDEKQAAALIGLTPACLQKWRTAGTGPIYRKLNGRNVRYSVADLEAFINAAPVGGGQLPVRPARVRLAVTA